MVSAFIRRKVINPLICHFELNFETLEAEFDISFSDYFAPELVALEPLAADKLVVATAQGFKVTASGRLLIRRICMIFDAYVTPDSNQQNTRRYSRIIQVPYTTPSYGKYRRSNEWNTIG